MNKLPYENGCYYEMVNCDEFCTRLMRLRCILLIKWLKRKFEKRGIL